MSAAVGAAHVPALAAGQDAGGSGPRRSLLLAGGGIRVAYQAGVLLALEEAGLTFAHADGTSGGTMNLSMLLSGLTPAQMCDRWRALRVGGFASLPSPRRLLRGPPLPALGSSAGMRSQVFPQLGIVPERIRAARGIAGTYNVGDFGAKASLAVEHLEVDEDLLVAAISLPVLSPAVAWRGRTLTDAAWIRDVNVGEAMRRGAQELWLVWCIGNHGVYRDGAFQQYVHMIEMSAGGALGAELAAIDRPVVLRVVAPQVPLPLDPDFFLGRVDAGTLAAMGYRDAWHTLDDPTPAPLAVSATRMRDPVPGVGWRETLVGEVGGAPLELRLGWEVDELEAFARDGCGTLVADATHPALGERQPARHGSFEGGGRSASLSFSGGELSLTRSRGGSRRVFARLEGVGESVLTLVGAPGWRTLHARGVGSMAEGARAVARFGRLAR